MRIRAQQFFSLVCILSLLAPGCRPKSEGQPTGLADWKGADAQASDTRSNYLNDASPGFDADQKGDSVEEEGQDTGTSQGVEVIANPECSVAADCSFEALQECQQSACVSGSCLIVAAEDGLVCDDGDLCTLSDQCSAGECLGEARDCDDSNPCTDDSCNEGVCSSQPNDLSCDDSEACTDLDQCVGGLCEGTPIDCEDGDECTADTCSDGLCLYVPSDGPCDDGDLCTLDDACAEDGCAGTEKICTDENPCTTDSCAEGDCSFDYNSLDCDDSQPCTYSDACSQGNCVGVVYACDEPGPCAALGGATCNGDGSCTYIADVSKDGLDCDDENPCTKDDECVAELCTGSAIDCDDGEECTLDSCDVEDGSCRHEGLPLDGESCEDGKPCTMTDLCVSGSCEGTAYSCDDPEQCRTAEGAICLGDGDCEYPADPSLNASPCDDQEDCTHSDVCASGSCEGDLYQCVLPGDCKTAVGATCNGDGTCDYPADSAQDGTSCDDGVACTYGDSCLSGLCAGDEYACTSPGQCRTAEGASCNGDGSCSYPQDPGQDGLGCDDELLCTHTDLCDGGECGGTAYECASPEQCRTATGAVCKGDGSCDYPPDASQDAQGCDDGSLCTHTDLCGSGSCAGTEYECDSPGACRTVAGALCLGDGSCTYPGDPGLDGEVCDDGLPCTSDDECLDGSCEGEPYSCTSPEQCRTAEGAVCKGDGTCDYPADSAQNGVQCDDVQLCTHSDTCDNGLCSGTVYACTDPEQCRTSVGAVCKGDGSCNYPVDGAQDGFDCNDGLSCTYDDECLDGSCEGEPYVCSSPEQCRKALGAECNGAGGCSYPADPAQDGAACEDEDPCTVEDICASGLCGGAPKDCADDNPCTLDQCDEDEGACLHNAAGADGLGCSDADSCSLNDRCDSGDCVPESYDCLNSDCSAHSECTPIDAGPGDLVITEIMGNPEGSDGEVDDALGEWFEVYNPTVRTRIFSGGTLVTQTGNADYGFEVVDGVVIPGQTYFVFGRSTDFTLNGGASVDYSYSGLPLNNTDEATVRVFLVAPNAGWDTSSEPSAEMVVDQVIVPEGVFLASEGGAGVSWQLGRLDDGLPSASSNDKSYNWCYVQDIENYQMSGGDYATPNSENAVCIKESDCDDGLDDDEDELIDCDDPDCFERTECLPPESACGDTLDNDNDDLVDCEDPSCDESPVCVNPKAVPGALVITEVMGNPSSVSDNNGEWFEIFNPGSTPVVIQGGVIAMQGSTGAFKSHSVVEPIVIDAGAYFIWGRSADSAVNGGVIVGSAYGSLSIVNSGQARIVLIAPGADWDGEVEPEASAIVDEVVLSSGSFSSSKAGRSLQLNSGLSSALDNDADINWCHTPKEPAYLFGSGDYGTPGAPNLSCD